MLSTNTTAGFESLEAGLMKIRTDNGKYTFIKDGLTIRVLRYGEPWHEQQQAFNAISSLMCALDAARVVLEAARAGGDVQAALRLHDGLVSDREPPSEWAGK